MIAPFEETIRDFGAVIARVNRQFRRDFSLFDHTVEAREEIFRRARVHLSPSLDRDRLKAEFVAAYRAPENAAPRLRAEAAYAAALAAARYSEETADAGSA